MATSNQSNATSSGKFPLDNLTYNLVTVLYEKSKGLEAYDKYIKDAQGDQEISRLFQEIRQQDEQHIHQLQQHLGRLIGQQSGKSAGASSGSSTTR